MDGRARGHDVGDDGQDVRGHGLGTVAAGRDVAVADAAVVDGHGARRRREGRDLAVPHAPRGRDAGDEDDPRRRGVAVVDLVADLDGAVEVVGALAVAEGRHGVMFLREVLEIGRFDAAALRG